MKSVFNRRVIRKNFRQLVLFGMAAVCLLVLFVQSQPVDPHKHNALMSDLRELSASEIALGEAVLQHHYQMYHNYDDVVAIMRRMQEIVANLAQYQERGVLPNTREVKRELGELQQQVEQKSAALEEFKSRNAVLKNTFLYLPRHVNLLLADLPESQHDAFELLVRDMLLITLDQGALVREALQQHIDQINQVMHNLPDNDKASARLVVKHAMVILENERDLSELLEQLRSQRTMGLGAKLEQLYLNYYQAQQRMTGYYQLLLLLAAMLMLSYAIYAYFKMREKGQQLRIAAAAFETQEGILVTDVKGNIIRVNQAFQRITGYSAEEVLGKNPRILSSGHQDKAFYAAMWESIHRTGSWQGEIWDKRKNGEIYPTWLSITATKADDGTVTHYVGTQTDITERKAAEEQIKNLAFYDPLTGLPNRRMLMDRLQQALAASVRSGRVGVLLFIDLDHFKTLNDTLGHDIGDLLLQQVAQRLKSCLRESDTVARLGGDEFVVMVEELGEQASEAASKTEGIGEKILDKLNQPYLLGKHECRSTASIGATLFSGNQKSMDELMKQADITMYQAKMGGRNNLRFFDPKMQETINDRVALEDELNKALEKQEFHLYYQIQVDYLLHPLGAEVLIRWIHPERGLVSPAQFIPLAEETGLILPIGNWVLETACAQLKAWQGNPLTRDLVLAVNVSAKQFRQAGFASQVLAIVEKHAINPRLIKLELTESMLQENIEDTIVTMNALNEIGIQFSLDDFGTGYSSLQYLKRLPLDQLKIDQSFVRDIDTDNNDRAIVRTLVVMAKSLDLDIIAEGVETEEQLQLLFEIGCTRYQGYLFCKPVPLEQFEELLGRYVSEPPALLACG